MLVCEEASVDLSTVSIGAKSVLHPKCCIEILNAPDPSQVYVTLGERNILDDMAVLSFSFVPTSTMTIGNNNLFESGCIIQAKLVGNNNWFEAKCQVGERVVIGDDCVIGAGVVVPPDTIVPNNSVLMRLPDGRIIRREHKEFACKAKQVLQDKYIEAFTEPTSPSYLPRNHRMKTK
ncbi:Dynactin subunit 6 [Aphanomyces cochlioides]|nr:Dynactin subunit 6 [Aphanomyces cochlioides]